MCIASSNCRVYVGGVDGGYVTVDARCALQKDGTDRSSEEGSRQQLEDAGW